MPTMRLVAPFTLLLAAVIAVGQLGAVPAGASSHSVTINFDEVVVAGDFVPVTDQYDGIVDITGAFGIVKGISQGDPGFWGLEGTDGPQFLGRNSTGAITFAFDEPISLFRIDCSRSLGSQSATTIIVTALDGEGQQLDQQSEVVGDVNTWSTFTVSSLTPFSTVTISNAGIDNPFGCDRLAFMPAEVPVATTDAPTTTDATTTTGVPTTTTVNPTTTGVTTTTSGGALPTTTLNAMLPATGSRDTNLLVVASLMSVVGIALVTVRRRSATDM